LRASSAGVAPGGIGCTRTSVGVREAEPPPPPILANPRTSTITPNAAASAIHVQAGTARQTRARRGIVSSVEVGGYSEGVGYDSGNGYVYVTNNEDFVSVISGTNVVATIPVGFSPFGVVYDSGNGYVYVANAGSDSVSVISTTADFRISPSPTSLTVVGESSLCEGRSIVCEDEASTSIGVSGVNGFMGNVRLTASVSPGDGSLIVYCRPPSILVKPGETSNAKCTVEPEISPASPATYVVTIRVTNGSLSHSITIPVVVTPATTR